MYHQLFYDPQTRFVFLNQVSRLARTSSFSRQSYTMVEKLQLVSGEEKLCEAAWCCLVGARAEARAGPLRGCYNSCSFAHWPEISSPQGRGAVSGILIGKSGIFFTSLHIPLHLLAKEERFCDVRQGQCFSAIAKNEISGNRNPIAVLVVLFIFFHVEGVINWQNKP